MFQCLLGMNSTLCRYFLHGVCQQGDQCPYSHDFNSKPSMVCKYYLQGNCSYGKHCRYDHKKPPTPTPPNSVMDIDDLKCRLKMTTLQKSSSQDEGLASSLFRKETWMNAVEFVPGRKSHVVSGPKNEYSSYASATNVGESKHGFYFQEPANVEYSEDPVLCPYTSLQECPNGNSCEYLHALQCDVCDEYCLHPFNEEQRVEHRKECLEAMEKDMEYSFAVQRSTSVSCSICLDIVTEKVAPSERLFGIMENCSHPFCLGCIRKWRGSGQQDSLVLRACPICRVPSGFVTPSDVWVEDEDEKKKLINRYQAVLSNKPCRYFEEGKGKCPFGSSCFYKHAFPDGSLDQKSPNLRFYSSSDEDGAILRDHNLWQFIEARDLRPYET